VVNLFLDLNGLKKFLGLVDRVKCGVNGLDEVIEGGFPKGSLILLAGEPVYLLTKRRYKRIKGEHL